MGLQQFLELIFERHSPETMLPRLKQEAEELYRAFLPVMGTDENGHFVYDR